MAGKKKWTLSIVIGVCIAALFVGGGLLLGYYKADFNKKLPMTATFESNDVQPEDVAYKFWLELIKPYQERDVAPWERLIDARFNKFQLLAGDKNDFAIGVTFWVKPESGTWSIFHNWGNGKKMGPFRISI